MKCYLGGHAIMLCLPAPGPNEYGDEAKLIRRNYAELEGRRGTALAGLPGFKPHAQSAYHVTLAYIGHDLTVDYAKRCIDAAWEAFAGCGPIVVDCPGPLMLWPAGQVINLVAPVSPTGALLQARTSVLNALKAQGVNAPAPRWNPHVTLGSVPRKGPTPVTPPDAPAMSWECFEVEVKYGQQRMRVELG